MTPLGLSPSPEPMRQRANLPLRRLAPNSFVRLVFYVVVVGLLAQLSGLAHLVGDTLFPHAAEVTQTCPDEVDGKDCPPGCPACHACDHRQAVPTPPRIALLPEGASLPVSPERPSAESPPSPPLATIFRPPRG